MRYACGFLRIRAGSFACVRIRNLGGFVLLILLVIATVTFFVFFNRARLVGETRGVFWGFSGAAAVIAPALIANLIVMVISLFTRFTRDGSFTVMATIGAFCLLAGIFLGKWMLDRFLPIPTHLYDDAEEEIPDED